IGGFDPQFHTAGDDVDLSWRLRSSGYRLGFAPGAFVWHFRRPSIPAFLRQQHGYGMAERLLIVKHPEKFTQHGGAQWEGFVYGGGPVRVMTDSIIYHGIMGTAGYQSVINRMLPLRGLNPSFDGWRSRIALCGVKWLVPRVRAWARNRKILLYHKTLRNPNIRRTCDEFTINNSSQLSRESLLQQLLADGWKPCDPTSEWDVEKNDSLILLATEHGADEIKHILVRVSGNEKTPFSSHLGHLISFTKKELS
ncbi:MAG: hypothetical protein H8M99_08770, partial [Gloeobacteraceae cyanobacterium ES-bin-144]|nr:hypothetical protein [Verrucomicrobiales bacterium]